MASASPVRRLRSKTSDLSDFLRGTGPSHSTPPPLPTGADLLPSPKKRRLPFLPRKKTFASLASATTATPASATPRKSTASGSASASRSTPTPAVSLDVHQPPSQKPSASRAHSSKRAPERPAPIHATQSESSSSTFLSSLPPVQLSPTPLTFSPIPNGSTPSPPSSRTPSSPPPSSRLPSPTKSSSHVAPSSPASPSRLPTVKRPQLDSIDVSPTPEITVSNPSPTDEGHDCGCVGRKTSVRSAPPPAGAAQEKLLPPEDISPGSPPETPRMQFPMPPVHSRPAVSFPAGSLGRTLSNASASESVRARNKLTISVKRELERVLGTSVDLDIETDEYDDATSPVQERVGVRQQAVSFTASRGAPSTWRESAIRKSAPSEPPSIPLPTPPPSAPLERQSSVARRQAQPAASTIPGKLLRPRAYTTTVIGGSSSKRQHADPRNEVPVPVTVALPPHPTVPAPRPPPLESQADKENASLSSVPTSPTSPPPPRRTVEGTLKDPNASPDQLRRALAAQRTRFDHLAGYVLALTEKHEQEKKGLERELRKREREIKGLRWLVLNGSSGVAVAPRRGTVVAGKHEALSMSETETETDAMPRPQSQSRSRQTTAEVVGRALGREWTTSTEDSEFGYSTPALETDSPVLGLVPSTAAAAAGQGDLKRSATHRATGSGDSVAALNQKELRRQSSPVVNAPGIASKIPGVKMKGAVGGGAGLGLLVRNAVSDSEAVLGADVDTDVDARSDVANLGRMSTAFSSTSSLSSLPALTAASTAASGLSAILESPQRSPSRSTHERQGEKEMGQQKQRDKDERRASRALRRISSSSARSTASSLYRAGVNASPPVPDHASTGATTAYAGNLRSGRTPTIEHVLAKDKEREQVVKAKEKEAHGHMEEALAKLRRLAQR